MWTRSEVAAWGSCSLAKREQSEILFALITFTYCIKYRIYIWDTHKDIQYIYLSEFTYQQNKSLHKINLIYFLQSVKQNKISNTNLFKSAGNIIL